MPRIRALGLMILAGAQMVFLAWGLAPLIDRVMEARGLRALERSAQIAFGADFAEFMAFVRETVPESAKLVVPSKAVDPVFGDIGLMQYFLRPRTIIDCPPGDDLAPCIRSLTGASTYILAVGDFPPQAEASLNRDLVVSRDGRGIYVPRAAATHSTETALPGTMAVGTALLLDLLVIGAIAGLGVLLVRAVTGGNETLLSAACAVPLGLAFLTWALFLFSWAGVRLTAWTVVGVALALGAFLLAIIFVRRGSGRDLASNAIDLPAVNLSASHVGWLVYVSIMGIALWLSVLRSYATWDDMAAYAIRGYGIAHEGSVAGSAHWGPSAATYPLNVQLGISIFHIVDGDIIPASKLLFPLFLGAILLVAYRVWRRAGFSDAWAGGLAFILGATPIILDHSATGYTNLPFSAYLLLGSVLILEGIVEGDPRRQLLGSLCLCGAIWTRPEGLPVVWGLIAGLVVTVRRPTRWGTRAVALLVPILAVSLSWIAYAADLRLGGQMSGALGALRVALAGGDVHLDAPYWTLRYLGRSLVDPSTWGLLLPLGLCLAVVAVRGREMSLRRLVPLGLLAASCAVAAAIFGFYYMVSLTGDLRFWLGTGVERMFLPAIVLGWIGLGALASPSPARSGV